METSSFVALSGMLALEQRMSTLAHNIANAGTSGFRAGNVTFEEVISRTSPAPTSFASPGLTSISEAAGGLLKTGNPLDVALSGNAYLAMQTPQGIIYSRDGRMTLTAEGQVVSLEGFPLLDVGGAPIDLDPQGGEIKIAKDGMIYQGNERQNALGLFALDLSDGFQRAFNSGIVPANEAQPVTTFSGTEVLQGYVEQSNVNPTTEMTRLIQVTRAFESLNTLTDRAQDAERTAMQVLGSR